MKYRIILEVELSDETYQNQLIECYSNNSEITKEQYINNELTGWVRNSFDDIKILGEIVKNYSQQEFIDEFSRRLKYVYCSLENTFQSMSGMIDGHYFSIDQELHSPYNFIVNGYASDGDFEEGESDDTGGCISRLISSVEWEHMDDNDIERDTCDFDTVPTDEQIKEQAEFAIELLGIILEDKDYSALHCPKCGRQVEFTPQGMFACNSCKEHFHIDNVSDSSKDFVLVTEYQKKFYDVLANGIVIPYCWPNAGFFNITSASNSPYLNDKFKCEDVKAKISENHTPGFTPKELEGKPIQDEPTALDEMRIDSDLKDEDLRWTSN